MVREFYVSGYAELGEKGIIRYRIDTDKKTIDEIGSVTCIENPTYMVPHPNGHVIYSGEKHKGEAEVVSFLLEDAEAHVTGKLGTGGISACHISLDPACEYLFAANYATGSLAVFSLGSDGSLLERTDFRQFEGHGADPVRQDRPHLHFALCTGETVYACDLGQDVVWVFDFDRNTGKLIDTDRNIHVRPGDGPRHLAIHSTHPGFLYLITEMACTVYVLRDNGNGYETIQTISSIPADYDGPENTAAAIRFSEDGTKLLVSNRGHDSIAVFQVTESGTLLPAVFSSSGGTGPRDFNVFGNLVVTSNQYSGDVVVYELDGLTLRDTGIRSNAGHPSCVQPVL